MKSFILITCLLQTALTAPQFITFKDGKVGVNFFGYHAEAGLGGGQNGANGGLLGGLHASAGTPWGQNAAAGLGGNVNGRAAGVLYAGAQATPDVGASAILGGDTSQGGFSGSDAYANGKVNSHTRTIVAGNTQKTNENAYPQYPTQHVTENINAIQKIRPPKKYYSSETYDFVEKHDLNNDIALNANKTKNIYDIEQSKTTAVATIVSTKTTDKTAHATPLHSEENYNIAPTQKTLVGQSLDIDSNVNNLHNQNANNEFNTASLPSTASSVTPLNIPSTVSLRSSLNGDNSNGNVATGVNANNPKGIITTITKLRAHPLKLHRNHQHKRINANRQRQTSKTIVKVVEQNTQQQQEQNIPHIYQQQQHHVRRQLIAPPSPPPHELIARPCDSMKHECKNVNKEVRSDVVQSALQIPIGILQSLQQSLGNLGSH